jgi:ribonuclease VapC
MIVDTSALMAIIMDEPEGDHFVDLLIDSDRNWISGGSWIEVAAVMTRRDPQGEVLYPILEKIVAKARLGVAPITAAQAQIGHEAYRRYGTGTGHPARLNFGDCFAYALAIDSGEPLLFKGDDFIHTDVARAF